MPASRYFTPLVAIALVIALLTGLPVASVGLNLLVGGTSATWAHLSETVLGDYVGNSLRLCLGVGCGVAIVGTATAWLTAMHDFPGRRVFEWALVLPLAVPAYVMAYVYTDLLQFVGPVQTALRNAFGWAHGDYWFPDVRSLPGAIAMFVCVLYPYVYLLARTAFIERAGGVLEAARTLGLGPWRAFFSVSLPLARPALAAGITLALMETLADYGTVAYFAVDTFTTGIYRAWFSLGDRVASAQLAAIVARFCGAAAGTGTHGARSGALLRSGGTSPGGGRPAAWRPARARRDRRLQPAAAGRLFVAGAAPAAPGAA